MGEADNFDADGFGDDEFGIENLFGFHGESPESEDVEELGSPPPVEDRLWRHPSEMAHQARADAIQPPPTIVLANPSRAHSIGVGVAGGLVGAALALGLVALLGRFGALVVIERPAPAVVRLDAPTATEAISAPPDGVPVLTQQTAPAIARIESQTPTGVIAGSAVAIREDGYLLTSAELVRGDPNVDVVLSSGQRVKAEVVGYDPYTNVGVVHLRNQQLRVPAFDAESEHFSGEDVVVLSAVPAGAQAPIVAKGIIGTPSRTVPRPGGRTLIDMIQVDASMAPGVTGGALLTKDRGEVIGILSTVVADETGSQSIGLATTTRRALQAAENLIEVGMASKVWLGVDGSSVQDPQAEEQDLPDGALITSVADASPAELAQLQPNDVITELNGVPTPSLTHLVLALRDHRVGQIVQMSFVRDGEQLTRLVILGESRNAFS